MRASADGYVTYLDSVEVTATERQSVEITVLAGADPVPTITLVGPEIGDDGKAHVSEPTVSLSWRTSGITPIETKVNGEVVVPTGGDDPREGDTLQVVAGLPLRDGENRFEIQITGQCGTSASATVVVVHGTVAVPDGGVPQADAGKAHLPAVTGGFGCGVTGAAAPLLALLALAALGRRRRAG